MVLSDSQGKRLRDIEDKDRKGEGKDRQIVRGRSIDRQKRKVVVKDKEGAGKTERQK